MFIVASQGPTPAYIIDLYHRLPAIQKRFTASLSGGAWAWRVRDQVGGQQEHDLIAAVRVGWESDWSRRPSESRA